MNKNNASQFLPLIKALSEGKTIQYNNSHGGFGGWVDLSEVDFTGKLEMYRIKPDSRPYKDEDEFLKASKEHGPYLKRNNGQIMIPRIIVCKKVIFEFSGMRLEVPLEELPKEWKWQDDSICGINEK